MNEEVKWLCSRCGTKDEPCIFINPATKQKPNKCPLNLCEPLWQKEKSELQRKVEEVEEMYGRWQMLAHDDTLDINFQLIVKFQNVCQLLKKDHTEFKEET